MHVRDLFQQGLDKLETLSPDTDQSIINALCSAESRNVFNLFPLLGFFVRSTDVRNAFEIHGPFLRIVRKILGDDAKLIISSEWNYSPFTFLLPEEYKLTNTVMIGVPAAESGNILTVPLAGHELGHNVWSHKRQKAFFGPKLEDAIKNEIRVNRWSDFQKFTNLGKPEDLDDLIGRQTWLYAWKWALRQSEELFCDFVGIALFRESFLYAFSYLLAPGFPQHRSNNYPSDRDRAKHQETAAKIMDVSPPENHESQYESTTRSTMDYEQLLLEIADAATATIVKDLAQTALKIVEDAGIVKPTSDEVETIQRCFSKGVPPFETTGLPAIVNAAWEIYSGGVEEWQVNFSSGLQTDKVKALYMLNELAFKSVEVYEIQSKQRNK